MEITPDPHFLLSLKNERLGWHACLAELIDNSLDAGATRAILEWKGGRFSIEDDGHGIPDISAVVRIGSHVNHKTTALGMYGVGVKHAWLWMSDGIKIATTRNGRTTTLDISIDQFKEQDGRWIVPDPQSVDCGNSKSGTLLSFGPLRRDRRRPGVETFKKLSIMFMPALEAGKQIVYQLEGRKKALAAHRMPAMQEAVTETFLVDDKQVHINIGIAQEGELCSPPGFLLCYRHRVIKNVMLGTGEYNASRMTGRITLGAGWSLTPHKDDLSDYSEELDAAIYERIKHMLAKAEQMSEAVESNAIRAEIESMVNECVRDATAKERRPGERREGVGSVSPKHSGTRRRKAADFDDKQEGSVENIGSTDKKRRGFKITWGFLGEAVLGQFFPETKTVMLNVDNRFIRSMRESHNNPAMFAVAVGLMCHSDDMMDGAQRLAICKGEFAESWGSIMSSIKLEAANAAH